MSSFVLEREQTIQLIKAYGVRRHLWDAGDARYFNRKLRDRAWREIGHELDLASSIPDLKKKIVSLLGSYRREKSREKQSIMSGLGPDEAYKSKWYGYEHFHFMSEKTFAGAPIPGQPHHIAHITHDTEQDVLDTIKVEYELYEGDEFVGNDENAEFDDEQQPGVASPTTPTSPTPQQRAKRKRRCVDTGATDEDSKTECLQNATTLSQKISEHLNEDPYVSFGLYIASELRKYDEVTLAHVKHAMNNVIFEADLGKYQREPASVGMSAPINGPAASSPSIDNNYSESKCTLLT